MKNLGPWLGLAFDEFKRNWKEHLIPSMVMFGITLVLVFGLMAIGVVAAAVLILLGSAISEDVAAVVAIACYALGLPLSIVLMVAVMTPLMVGYYRIVLRVMRGEPYELSEMFALDGLGKAVVGNLVGAFATGVAAMFCYLPALPVSVLFFFTLPLIADNKADSGMDAVRKSIALARQDFMGLLVYWVVALMIGMVVAYIPFVGAFVSMPLFSIFILTPYLALTRGEGEQPAQLEEAPVSVEKDLANPYSSPRRV